MRPNVRDANDRVHYRPTDRVAARLGFLRGIKPSSAHQFMYGHGNPRAGLLQVIEACQYVGDLDRLYGYLRPILQAMLTGEAEPLEAAVIHRVQLGDLAEDQAESAYLADPTTENLKAWHWRAQMQQDAHAMILRSIEHKLEQAGAA